MLSTRETTKMENKMPKDLSNVSADIDKSYISKLVANNKPLIFDIGCYDGKDSLEFLKLFSDPLIYAFEADKRSLKLFHKNCNSKKIILQPYALTNTDGEIDWYASDSPTRRHYEDQDSWSASSSAAIPKDCLGVFSDVSFKKESVTSYKLDTWVEKYLGSNVVVDFMWIDVNGAEKDFILGALKTLKNTRFIYTEFCKTDAVQLYENAISKDEILDMLPQFEELGIYSFLGNYGNILLRNNSLG